MLIDTNKDIKYLNGRYYFFDISDSKRTGYFDFTNLTGDEAKKVIQDFIKFYEENEFINLTGNAILDFTNTRFSNDVIVELKRLSKLGSNVATNDHKIAVIGQTGLRKILINIFSKVLKKNLKPFDTKEEAINWLIESD